MEDEGLVSAKLESLMRCIHRIELKRPDSLATLEADLDVQDILAVNLERAVQLCVDICMHLLSSRGLPVPGTMAEGFGAAADAGHFPPELAKRLARGVGFRDIAVHQYDKINWKIVYDIVWKRLGDFREFSGYVTESMQSRS